MMVSKGRYWDKPWSLVSSCTRCSPGCQHCWALAMEKRFHKGVEGQIVTHPDRLSIPLRTRKPTVFSIWNDWGHEELDHDFRQVMVRTAEKCPQHTILALTKRPCLILDFYEEWMLDRINARFLFPDNWWTGLTVCNQAEADEKIPIFLQVPGKKFLNIEPLLGAVDLTKVVYRRTLKNVEPGVDLPCEVTINALAGDFDDGWDQGSVGKIDAVILGGETGPGARPMHPDWVRLIRGQCFAAGIPFFFKSWGKHIPALHDVFGDRHGVPVVAAFDRALHHRMLDGRTHDELPWEGRSMTNCRGGRDD